MVTIDDVTKLVRRINIATARHITTDQVETIRHDLADLNMGDEEFWKVSASYLDEEDMPRNIVKYFRDAHYKKLCHDQNDVKTSGYSDSVAGEYSGDQAGMFCRCCFLALSLYTTAQSYTEWANYINGAWEKMSGEKLSAFLSGEKKRLTEEIIGRRR